MAAETAATAIIQVAREKIKIAITQTPRPAYAILLTIQVATMTVQPGQISDSLRIQIERIWKRTPALGAVGNKGEEAGHPVVRSTQGLADAWVHREPVRPEVVQNGTVEVIQQDVITLNRIPIQGLLPAGKVKK